MADMLTKAVTKDGFMRIYAVVSTDAVNQAQKYHGLSPLASATLGRMLSVGLMMGGTLKEADQSITIQLRGDGPLGLSLVVADGAGHVKGYIANPAADLPLKENGKIDVGHGVGKGTLSIIKDLKMKEPYIGQVPIQTGEIGDDMAYYFLQSEQIPSVVSVGVLVDRDYSISHAGGLIIQVMPGCDERSISFLEKSIQNLESVTQMLKAGMDGEAMIRNAMLGFDISILESYPVSYHCGCSKERMERAIISLGKKEIESLIEEEGKIEITCQFCDQRYEFSPEELGDLMLRCKR